MSQSGVTTTGNSRQQINDFFQAPNYFLIELLIIQPVTPASWIVWGQKNKEEIICPLLAGSGDNSSDARRQ
jgi:hypothetical protein